MLDLNRFTSFSFSKNSKPHKVETGPVLIFVIFQERVDAISGEDRLLTKRIFELREAAQQASLAGGGVEMFQLSQELEVLINRQRALVQERDDHERHIK